PVDATPVFVRAGAIVPEQAPGQLILNVYGQGGGAFELYEDDGSSLNADAPDAHATTRMTHAVTADGVHHLTIGPARGSYAGQPARRAYELRLHGAGKPASLTVDGRSAAGWSFAADGTAVAQLPAHPVGEELRIDWR
ncbi:MAG: DUF5110 domain-containing protein, partial [Gammaproteobacteria bacterium]|nr:DUF5110 domain-containing protein [Gammaproteobacteria bacterium]